MPVQKICNGWRARRKMGTKTFNGPIRNTEAAANKDAQQLEEAAAVSIERLQEVHDRLTCLLLASVAKHGSGWQVRVTVGKEKVRGPTRQLKGEAGKDCLHLTGLQHMSTAELQNALLHQQVAEVGAARERDARFKEVVLAEMRNCLALQQPGKRARRARNVDSERDYSLHLHLSSCRRESCVGVQCGVSCFWRGTTCWTHCRDHWGQLVSLNLYTTYRFEEFAKQLLAELGATVLLFLWAVTACLHRGFDGWKHGE